MNPVTILELTQNLSHFWVNSGSYTTLHKLAIFVKTWNMGRLTFNLYFAQGVVTPIAPYLLPQSESLPKFGCDLVTTP